VFGRCVSFKLCYGGIGMVNSILFAILHGQGVRCRRETLMSTWLNGQDYLFCADYDDGDKVKQFSARMDHFSAEEKHVRAIKHILASLDVYNHEWFFFCDDDTFVNVPLLNDVVKSLVDDMVYGELISCWDGDRSLKYFSGGAGYLVPRRVLLLADNIDNMPHTEYSDVRFGAWLRQEKIKCVNDDRYHSQPPKFYGDIDVRKQLTFHYIKRADEMKRLWDFVVT
jgi:hypothetical protein